VSLTVTDNRGASSSVSHDVSVTVTPNQAPAAAFTFACTQLVCSFDGSGSSDPDGTVQGYAWDFGDGATADTATASHAFAADNTYPVKLTVTDNGTGSTSLTKNVTVAATVNAHPVAAFVTSCTNLACSFDASTSTDSDGTVAGYAWNFGDSTPAGAGKTSSHTYAAAGTYSVQLTVTDNQGATGTKTGSVIVTSAPAGPIAADTFGRTVTRWGNANTGGTYTYSGSTFSTNGTAGKIVLASPGGSATALLNAVSARDVNVLTDFSVDKMATGSGTYNSLLVRKVGTSDYRMAFQELTGGKVKLTISKTVNNTATVLRQVALTDITYTAGDKMRVRFQVSGNGTTSLSAKVWKVGAAEPVAAQASVSDTTASLQAAGSFAITSYLAANATNAPVTVSVDNLLITAN
jgi:PKD repeat protein